MTRTILTDKDWEKITPLLFQNFMDIMDSMDPMDIMDRELLNGTDN